VLAADNTLTIKKTNRDPVESTQVQRGEMPEEALLRLGYTRASRGQHAQPMPWSPQPDGSLWTTAVRTERVVATGEGDPREGTTARGDS
jgi:hypothetical protein